MSNAILSTYLNSNYVCIFDVSDQIFIALIIQIIRHFISFFEKLRSKKANPLKGRSIFSLLSAEESSGRRILWQGKKKVFVAEGLKFSKWTLDNFCCVVATSCSKTGGQILTWGYFAQFQLL